MYMYINIFIHLHNMYIYMFTCIHIFTYAHSVAPEIRETNARSPLKSHDQCGSQENKGWVRMLIHTVCIPIFIKYVYICIHTYTYICIYICIYLYICIYVYPRKSRLGKNLNTYSMYTYIYFSM